MQGAENGFELSWKPSPESDIVEYKIYLRSLLKDKKIGSTEATNFTADTLNPDTEYTVSVTAVDIDGLESEEITVRTLGE